MSVVRSGGSWPGSSFTRHRSPRSAAPDPRSAVPERTGHTGGYGIHDAYSGLGRLRGVLERLRRRGRRVRVEGSRIREIVPTRRADGRRRSRRTRRVGSFRRGLGRPSRRGDRHCSDGHRRLGNRDFAPEPEYRELQESSLTANVDWLGGRREGHRCDAATVHDVVEVTGGPPSPHAPGASSRARSRAGRTSTPSC